MAYRRKLQPFTSVFVCLLQNILVTSNSRSEDYRDILRSHLSDSLQDCCSGTRGNCLSNLEHDDKQL
jgi:hypothetical protein